MSIEAIEHIEKMWEISEADYKNKRYPQDFPVLPEIAAGRYTREDFFQIENEYLWKRVWLFAGFLEDLPEPGCYKTVKISGTPVLVVRGNDQKIRAFYNVCKHRGAVVAHEASGKSEKFVCRYHCWSYDLTGKLTTVPDERQFPEMDKTKKSLTPVNCETFGNMIFINFDKNAEPLSEYLGSIVDVLSDVPFERVKVHKSMSLELPYNWKVLQDNFSENYHAAMVHPGTINPLINAKVTARQLLRNGHGAFAIKSRQKAGDKSTLWEVSADDGPEEQRQGELSKLTGVAQRNYNIFPNLTMPVAEDIFPLIQAWPLTVGTTRVDIYFLKVERKEGDSKVDPSSYDMMVNFLEGILKEDFWALDGIQEAMASGGAPDFRLCWEEQVIYHHNNNIDRVIGAQNIPEELRVKSVDVPLAGA